MDRLTKRFPPGDREPLLHGLLLSGPRETALFHRVLSSESSAISSAALPAIAPSVELGVQGEPHTPGMWWLGPAP